MEYLVEKVKVNVNVVTESGSAAVLVAIEYNHLSLLQYLVETGKANVQLVGKVDHYSCSSLASKHLILHRMAPLHGCMQLIADILRSSSISVISVASM